MQKHLAQSFALKVDFQQSCCPIRNKGAEHLKPISRDLSMYQALNIDLILVIAVFSIVGLYINYKILRMAILFSCCRFREKKAKTE